MADGALVTAIAFVQLALMMMGTYVSFRPVRSERHRVWMTWFLSLGLFGMALTVWMSIRSGDSQTQLAAMVEKANSAATKAAISAEEARKAAEEASSKLNTETTRREQAEKGMALMIESAGRATRAGVAEDIRKSPITINPGNVTIQSDQMPLVPKEISILSIGRVNSSKKERPFAIKVVLGTNVVLQPVKIRVVCSHGEVFPGGWGMTSGIYENPRSDRTPDGVEVAFTSPPFRPETPMTIELNSTVAFSVKEIIVNGVSAQSKH